jgi:hypothetical protein
VEGQLAYYKSPETNRETYSIWADNFTYITPPKSTAAKTTTVTVSLDEDAYGVFQTAVVGADADNRKVPAIQAPSTTWMSRSTDEGLKTISQ